MMKFYNVCKDVPDEWFCLWDFYLSSSHPPRLLPLYICTARRWSLRITKQRLLGENKCSVASDFIYSGVRSEKCQHYVCTIYGQRRAQPKQEEQIEKLDQQVGLQYNNGSMDGFSYQRARSCQPNQRKGPSHNRYPNPADFLPPPPAQLPTPCDAAYLSLQRPFLIATVIPSVIYLLPGLASTPSQYAGRIRLRSRFERSLYKVQYRVIKSACLSQSSPRCPSLRKFSSGMYLEFFFRMTSLSSKADRAPRVRGGGKYYCNSEVFRNYFLDIFLMIALNRAKKKHITAFVAVQLRQAKASIAAVEVCKLTNILRRVHECAFSYSQYKEINDLFAMTPTDFIYTTNQEGRGNEPSLQDGASAHSLPATSPESTVRS